MQGKVSKNILLVTHFLPPLHTAGTEQYTLGLGKALRTLGHRVTFVCAADWNKGDDYWNGVTKETLEEIPIYRIHLNWLKAGDPNQNLYDSLVIEKWFDQFLKDNRFDIAHVTSTHSLGVGILRSIKRAGTPLVLTLTDFWFLCPSIQLLRSDGSLCDGNTTPWQCQDCLMTGSNLYRRMGKIHLADSINLRVWDTFSRIPILSRLRGMRGYLLNMSHRKRVMMETFALPDVIISPSQTVKNLFLKNSNRNIELLLHGYDLDWLNDYHGKIASTKIRIGYIGQIQKIKGVHLLIEAFKKAGIGKNAQLDIWGDFLQIPEYTKMLNGLIGNDPGISLQGRYVRSQLASVMANIDVMVVPSLWYENSPLVIREAFAAKTPVITTNLGGMSEAVTHDVNGLLFERNNSDDLAVQLRRVVDESGLLEKLKSTITPVRKFQDELIELEMIYDQLVVKK